MTIAAALEIALAVLVLGMAAWTIAARETFAAVVGFVAYGLLLALVWVRLDAVDVALTEAAIGGLSGILRLVQPRLRRGHARLRGAQGIELIVRFQLGHHLSRLDMIADVDRPLDHSARDPKSQTCLVLGLDAAGKRDGFADVALHDGHGPHRTNLRRGGVGFGLAGCEQGRGQPGQHESRARAGTAEQAAHG
jgi:uncharacterized MnhB-related membrane protein